MITQKEIESTKISEISKDYYQIWNDLLEVSSKISERWDPTSTNESDPGIVLLKVLTACLDKLNYNVDKNTLEAFMPSAAQEESMRKLCDMMGYRMKYYLSATANITVYFKGDEWSADPDKASNLIIPRYTKFTNTDGDIVYTSIEDVNISDQNPVVNIKCIEGIIKICEENTGGIINLELIDSANRYYLPTEHIAENGIFVYSALANGTANLNSSWEKVENLNTEAKGAHVYKFGYDSKRFMPYIEFPDDIGDIIENGLIILYTLTNGLNGNISARTITKIDTTPIQWNLEDYGESSYNTTGISHTADEFGCYNALEIVNGADKESITNAYKNFKKTIGTFNTLITCRDYMNKIYQLTYRTNDSIEATDIPMVSNIIVSDIRDDINRAVTICSFESGSGMTYIDKPLTVETTASLEYDYGPDDNPLADYENLNKIWFKNDKYYICTVTPAPASDYIWAELINTTSKNLIDHFDLVFYPFYTYNNFHTTNDYKNSFRFNENIINTIANEIKDYKTISHNILSKNEIDSNDIVCIKNYLKLNSKITTTAKVTDAEWKSIKEDIIKAIYKTFNMRQLDFSEEIPYDDILNTIKGANPNIKNVVLDDPDLYTAVVVKELDLNPGMKSSAVKNVEYLFVPDNADEEIKAKYTPAEKNYIKSEGLTEADYLEEKKLKAKQFYNKLTLRNILAGRIEFLKYDTNFAQKVDEVIPDDAFMDTDAAPNYASNTTYVAGDYVTYDNQVYQVLKNIAAENNNEFSDLTTQLYEPVILPEFNNILPKLEISNQNGFTVQKDITLTENQYIQFRAPNLRTIKSYPAYVNYYLHLNQSSEGDAIPAEMQTLFDYLSGDNFAKFKDFLNDLVPEPGSITPTLSAPWITCSPENPNKQQIWTQGLNNYSAWFYVTSDGTNYTWNAITSPIIPSDSQTYYQYPINAETFGTWNEWLKTQEKVAEGDNKYNDAIAGLYKNLGYNVTNIPGRGIDENKNKYQHLIAWYPVNTTKFLQYFYLRKTSNSGNNQDGLGRDQTAAIIPKDTEYALKDGEYLCINYTDASSTPEVGASGVTLATSSSVVNIVYKKGDFIKPNFDLQDSTAKNETGSRWAKTTGFTFPNTYTIPGMFSLGTSEQIDIREIVQVYVYEPSNSSKNSNLPINVYFNLQDEPQDGDFWIPFNGTDGKAGKYILKEGEYFWYTDAKKTTITYIGAGTEIENYTSQRIQKDANTKRISTDEILENGLADIPWISLAGLFVADANNPGGENDKYLKWTEYQTVTLGEGDTIRTICGRDSTASGIELNLDNEWKPCADVNYTVKDATSESKLPDIKLGGDWGWEVRTYLGISTSANIGQTLKTDYIDEQNDRYYSKETIKLELKDEALPKPVYSDCIIKSNYLINLLWDKIPNQQDYYLENYSELTDKDIGPHLLKRFVKKDLYLNEDTTDTLTINNFSGNAESNAKNYTLVSFEDYVCTKETFNSFFTLNYIITNPQKTYGLVMFYYDTESTSINDYAMIKLTAKNIAGNEEAYTPSIFNNGTINNETWWSGDYVKTPAGLSAFYVLKPGLNIIRLKNNSYYSYELSVYPPYINDNGIKPKENRDDNLYFSDLSIIDNSDENLGIDQDLIQYYGVDDNGHGEILTGPQQLFKDINLMDPNHQFYYNFIPEQSLQIDINTKINENLKLSKLNYDYNNINNKFVISEIDADYLDKGIMLASSSSKGDNK